MSTGFDKLDVCDWNMSDAKAVAKYTKKSKSTDWEKRTLSDVRTRLRASLLLAQRNFCAYCRRRISLEFGRHDVDHILAKGLSQYARFTYERINLVASCKRCNTNKKNVDVLKVPFTSTSTYPIGVDDYSWVHPYVHKYSEHIQIREGVLFEAIGTADHKVRAEAVINACGLKTLPAVEHRCAAEIAQSADNATFALTSMVGGHPHLSVSALTTLLKKNRKDFRAVPSPVVQGMIAAFRRLDLAELEKLLILHRLK